MANGRGGELGAQADGPACGVAEAEELGGQFAAGLSQEELGGFQQGGVERLIAVKAQKGGEPALEGVASVKHRSAKIGHAAQSRNGTG